MMAAAVRRAETLRKFIGLALQGGWLTRRSLGDRSPRFDPLRDGLEPPSGARAARSREPLWWRRVWRPPRPRGGGGGGGGAWRGGSARGGAGRPSGGGGARARGGGGGGGGWGGGRGGRG